MRIRVLLISDSENFSTADVRMLKDRGLLVHTCYDMTLAQELAKEISPDIIILNPENADSATTRLYHNLLDNLSLARVPVVYTLAEDDVYLVSRKRTSFKAARNSMTDNLTDAIKFGMTMPKAEKASRAHIAPNFDTESLRVARA